MSPHGNTLDSNRRTSTANAARHRRTVARDSCGLSHSCGGRPPCTLAVYPRCIALRWTLPAVCRRGRGASNARRCLSCGFIRASNGHRSTHRLAGLLDAVEVALLVRLRPPGARTRACRAQQSVRHACACASRPGLGRALHELAPARPHRAAVLSTRAVPRTAGAGCRAAACRSAAHTCIDRHRARVRARQCAQLSGR